MRKLFRRMKWAVRKQYLKNFVAVTTFCTTFLFLVFTFYDDCSYFRILPMVIELDNCKPSDDTKRERLNTTLVSLADNTDNGIISGNEKQSLFHDEGVGLRKRNTPVEVNRKATVLVPVQEEFHSEMEETNKTFKDMIFIERRSEAVAACDEMLRAELEKAKGSVPITEENTLRLLDNDTMMFRKVVQKAIYNKNVIHLMKYRNRPIHQRPKYFQSTPAIKKNRWVHFHRIIKSPTDPANSRVIDIKWCPIFKAASTPWLAVFTKLSHALTNYTEAQIKHGKLGFMELAKTFRLLTPRIYDKSINVIKYSMVVVRHPFKRLLSAYRDKIERVKGRLYYYKKYSSKIIVKFRKSELGALERSSKDKDYSLKVPTFEEFVHYILSTDPRKLDEHWRPMYLDCNPCHRNFDLILKVETLDDDKQKVMQCLGISQSDPQYKEVEDVWVRWNNPSGRSEPNRNESYYFSQLTIPDIQKLYQLYEPDFKSYGYSPDAYFFMGKEDPET